MSYLDMLKALQQALENLEVGKFITHPSTESFEEDRLRLGLEPTACV